MEDLNRRNMLAVAGAASLSAIVPHTDAHANSAAKISPPALLERRRNAFNRYDALATKPLGNNTSEWLRIVDDRESYPEIIRSHEDWTRYLQANPSTHPLATCDPTIVEDFTKSLIFKDGGLGHAEFGMIMDEISYLKFAELWALFGMSMSYFDDRKDYKCTGPGNCEDAPTNICTDKC